MTNVTSPARENHICQDNDYFQALNVPDGFSAKRTNESGIFECMKDPGLPKDQSFVRFKSTNQNFLNSSASMTHSERNKSSSPLGQQALKPIIEQSPYGLIIGRGTKISQASKLREICGRRNPSADLSEHVRQIAQAQQRPRPHKKQLIDGHKAAFDGIDKAAFASARQSGSVSGQLTKGLEEDPISDYMKVPCRFTGWKFAKVSGAPSMRLPQRDQIRIQQRKGFEMLRSMTNKQSQRKYDITGKPHESQTGAHYSNLSIQAVDVNQQPIGIHVKQDFNPNQGVTVNKIHRDQMAKGLDESLKTLNLEKIRLNLQKNRTASFSQLRQNHNVIVKQKESKVGGANFMPIQAKLNVTRQDPLDLPHMVRSIDERVHHYRKPTMKEKSSVQNDLVMQSRDKRAKDQRNVIGKKRANSVIHNAEVVIFGGRKMSEDNTFVAGSQTDKTATWAGMNIIGDPNHRFKRTKDHIRDWQDQVLIKGYDHKHSGHELSSKLDFLQEIRIPQKGGK